MTRDRSSARSLLSAALITLWLAGAGAPGASGAASGPERGGPIADCLRRFVADGTVAGAVGLVADRAGVLWHDAVGLADVGAGRAMDRDALFWIASMTKPMTAVAAMMLVEQGRLATTDPVEKHLPEFRGQWRIETQAKDVLTLRRPGRAVTLRDLFTHTSGLAPFDAPRHDCSLGELVIAASQRPLLFEPGTQWKYSNSGMNTLGRVVETVAGVPYARFMQERIFAPLDMRDTTFWPTRAQIVRLAKSYRVAQTGAGLEEAGIRHLQGDLDDRTRTPLPMGGLFSTAADVARFYRMLLGGGELDGHRLLKPESVALMTRTHTGDLTTGFAEGMSYGLGFGVVKTPSGATARLAAGSFGHGGAHGTQSWADPTRGIIYVLMIQRVGMPNGDASDIRRAFQEAAADRYAR